MALNQRALLVLHGAVVLLLGLVAGLPAVVEELAGTQPQTWRAGHNALLLAGVWLLGTAAILPVLSLPRTQLRALVWSLLVTGYAFTTAVLVQAVTGVRALAPRGGVATVIAYGANLVTVAAGLLAAVLTAIGAARSLRSEE